MDSPLEGIRVLDFTQYQQGPVSTVMLADWGADVVKLEPRSAGDPGRFGVPWGKRGATAGPPYFEAYNRGKRSIAVDLKKEKGREIVYRLAAEADILAQNWRAGVADRLGIGYEAMSRVNPRIIYLSGTGFGLRGPLRTRPGFDSVGQAMGGLMSVNGLAESPEHLVGAAIGDQTGGYLLSWGALLALFDRERTGKGQHVDVSLVGSIIALQGQNLLHHLLTGNVAGRGRGAGASDRVFVGSFRDADGRSFVIHTSDNERTQRVFAIAGLDEDQRFDTAEKKGQNQGEMIDAFRAVFSTRTRDEWLVLLEAADVPCAPVYDYSEVAAEPQIAANEYIAEIDHPAEGPTRVVGQPIHLSGYRPTIGIAPLLGQHADEILKEVGYSEAEVATLREEEVI